MTTMPERIQLSRKKGWRKPEGAVTVARPSRWGNPFKVKPSEVWKGEWRVVGPEPFWFVGHFSTKLSATRQAVDLYALHTGPMGNFEIESDELDVLRGHDLACWCPLDQPCHADVLLELANS